MRPNCQNNSLSALKRWRLNYHDKDYYEMNLMEVICGWCGKHLAWKFGSGISHGICKECAKRMEEEI